MVTVKLTPNSSIGLLNINPDQQITREKEAEVSVVYAINCIADPNYLFTFSEDDRLELENANSQLLASASIGLGIEDLTAEMLVKTLLPPKRILKKRSAPKSTKKSVAKDSTKSALTE